MFRPAGLGGVVSRCLGGERACEGDRAQGGGAAWHRGGVGGWLGESLRFDLHPGDGLAEDSGGGDFRSKAHVARLRGYAGSDLGSWLARGG